MIWTVIFSKDEQEEIEGLKNDHTTFLILRHTYNLNTIKFDCDGNM